MQLAIPDKHPNVCNTPFVQLFAFRLFFPDVRDSIFSAQPFTPNAELRTWQGVTGHVSMIPCAKWKLPIGHR
jgi:hypothetical protein